MVLILRKVSVTSMLPLLIFCVTADNQVELQASHKMTVR